MPDRRVVGLDVVRFAAAFMVVVAHIGPSNGLTISLPPFLGDWGGNGVSLFFVLSGYLLWRPFVKGRPALRSYALARVGRILPAFWLACLVLVPLRGGDLARFLVMLPDRGTPLGVLWTLQAEVLFYLALPYLGRIGRPLAIPIVGGLISLGLDIAMAGTAGHATVLEAFLPFRFWAFAPGMILAAWQPRTDWRWLATGAGLLVVGVLTLPFTPGGGQYIDIPTVIGAGFVVGWGIHAKPLGARVWAAGAAISYGLYLWHLDLYQVFGDIGLPLAFLVASGSYVILERPVMRWVKTRVTGWRGAIDALAPEAFPLAPEAFPLAPEAFPVPLAPEPVSVGPST